MPTILAGCLRNARAVALAASRYGAKIAVIAAGERWLSDFSLRPAFEDLVGAGAIIRHLPGAHSPEAMAAVAAFEAASANLRAHLFGCISGKELIDIDFEADVHLAAQLNVSTCVPQLVEGAYMGVR
jgi:2-phosphosulfolactate phosphatase